ncbi:MAG TPA: transglutaminase-like domain-containing protein [Acidimicrobiales bacterium]|nr:transglutaminase-like domain-containing protein [Acidimicrobiales bacterium]
MRASDEFLALVTGPEERIALDEGCLLIAAHAKPASDPRAVVSAGRAQLDALAAACDGVALEDVLDHLFGTLGFYGNRARYDDPRNSYLDEVLARRTGIPITLSIVVIEVGRRVGLTLAPVGMPGHFLVGAGEGQYVDAFEHGHVLDMEGCRRRFVELAGATAPWSPQLLAPVGPRAVLARVLANLRRVFADARDLANLEWVLALRSGIPGVPPAERAERANVLAALGRFDEAARELERVAPSGGGDDGFTAAELRARAARWRARLN